MGRASTETRRTEMIHWRIEGRRIRRSTFPHGISSLPETISNGNAKQERHASAVTKTDASHMKQWALTKQHDDKTHRIQWLQMVESFSTRRFTVEADKLVAFSGMARRLAPYFQAQPARPEQPQYIAGLWTSELISQLLWRVASINSCRAKFLLGFFGDPPS